MMTDRGRVDLNQMPAFAGERPTLHPAMRAVVRDEQRRVLLVQHSRDFRWRLPEGDMEPGESIIDCLRRVLKVHIGLEVIRARPMAIYSDPGLCIYADAFGDAYHLLTLTFLVEPGDWFGLLRPDGVEVLDAHFFDLKGPDLPDVGAVDRELLKDLARFDGRVVVK